MSPEIDEDESEATMLDLEPIELVDEEFFEEPSPTSLINYKDMINQAQKRVVKTKKEFKPYHDDLQFANRDFIKNMWLWAAVYSLPILMNALNHYGAQRNFWA